MRNERVGRRDRCEMGDERCGKRREKEMKEREEGI
jgi:hypothetical protein